MAPMSQNLLKCRNQSGKRISQGINRRIQNDTSEGGSCEVPSGYSAEGVVQCRALSVPLSVDLKPQVCINLFVTNVSLSLPTEVWNVDLDSAIARKRETEQSRGA